MPDPKTWSIDAIEISPRAEKDLDCIGELTAPWIVGELFRLPDVDVSEISELEWRRRGEPQGYAWRIGPYVALFHVRSRLISNEFAQSAVIERIRHVGDVRRYLRDEGRRAKRRDERIARQEKNPARS